MYTGFIRPGSDAHHTPEPPDPHAPAVVALHESIELDGLTFASEQSALDKKPRRRKHEITLE